MPTPAEAITQASVAVSAARIMADPAKFCQGYWALDASGRQVVAETPELTKARNELNALYDEPQSPDRDSRLIELSGKINDLGHWVQANSPDARQFCIEGACMAAAPDVVTGRVVIDALDQITQDLYPNYDEDTGETYRPIAQTVNDSVNESEAREKLVHALLILADRLLNGPDEDRIEVEETPEAPVPPGPTAEFQPPSVQTTQISG